MKQNPDKTDFSDSRLLADLVRVGYLPKVWLAPEELRRLRRLVRYRQQLVDQRRDVKLRIRALLRDNRIRTPKECNAWTKRWLKWLDSPCCPLTAEDDWMMKRHLASLQRLSVEIREVEKKLLERAADDAVIKRLMQFAGVGLVTAVTRRAEIGQFDRFQNGKQLSRFCGVTPRNASSGNRQADAFIEPDYTTLAGVNTNIPAGGVAGNGRETAISDPHRQSVNTDTPAFWAVYVTDKLTLAGDTLHLGLTHESWTSSYVFVQGSRAVPAWAAREYAAGEFVFFENTVFVRSVAGTSSANPVNEPDAWEEGGRRWQAGEDYAYMDRVMSPTTFKMYYRLIAGAGDMDPSEDALNWLAAGEMGAAVTAIHEFGHQLMRRGEHTGAVATALQMALRPHTHRDFNEEIFLRSGGIMNSSAIQVRNHYLYFHPADIFRLRSVTSTTR